MGEYFMENRISIVCQNLNGHYKHNSKLIEKYKNKIFADIYAFQEFPEGRSFCTKFQINNPKINFEEVSNEEVQKIWDNVFYRTENNDNNEWKDFRTAYWCEANLTYQGEKIRIVNLHCSPYYSEQLRYILINRILELKSLHKNIMLLGDFNAAEYSQNEDPKIWGQALYHTITDILKFDELFCKIENKEETINNPHYTFAYNHQKGKWKRKKLDHIFVSKNMHKLLCKWGYSINYIDEVNYNADKLNKLDELKNSEIEAFTDHSGIMLQIGVK